MVIEYIKLVKEIIEVKHNQKLSRSEILKIREEKLRKLLRYVLTHSRFYQRYYKKHNITLRNINQIKIKDIPTINKEILMENFDDIVCDHNITKEKIEKFLANPKNKNKKFQNKNMLIHTSGSTGKLGFFIYGPNDSIILRALAISRVTKAKISPFKKTKIAFIGATDGNYAGVSLVKSAPKLFFKTLTLNINKPIEEITKEINKFQPDILTGYSSGINLLAQQQLKNNVHIKLKRILCSADALNNISRKTIKQAFKIEPVNFYAASESISMAVQCEKNKDELELFDDYNYFEILNENQELVKPNQTGKLIITNLYNYTLPLIRYEMNDELTLSENLSHKTSPFRHIENISGRSEDFLWFEKNKKKEFIHPITFVEFYVEGLEKFQIEQVKQNSILFKAVIKGDEKKVKQEIKKRLNEILKEKKLEKTVKLEIKIVKEIPQDSRTGKFKLILPLKEKK